MKPLSQLTLVDIAERLRTQDNRSTSQPMFCVQELKREWGIDSGYTETFGWVDDEGNQLPGEEPGAHKVGYRDRWETVMVAFTEVGCKEYLALDGHNLGETRIYVESFNRCPEMILIRELLMRIEASKP